MVRQTFKTPEIPIPQGIDNLLANFRADCPRQSKSSELLPPYDGHRTARPSAVELSGRGVHISPYVFDAMIL